MYNQYSYFPQQYPNYQGQNVQMNVPQNNSLIRVTGIEGAKAYQMPANSTVALFDNNEDFFYVKSTDGAGFPTIRKFKFTEENQMSSEPINTEFVSKQEFEAFKQEVLNYGKQFIQSSDTDKSTKSIESSKNNN